MHPTSLSLLDRARADLGDGAWDRLVDLYTPLLRGSLARLGVQQADVDDLVQEILLAVARDLATFVHSGRPGAFRTWLRTILYHRVRDFWRSRKYRPEATGGTSWTERLDQLQDDDTEASRLWNQEHDQHVMARLLELVRPRYEAVTWEAFRRQVLDGERADAVAAALGLSLNSVYVARSRVLAALRREAAGLIDDDRLA